MLDLLVLQLYRPLWPVVDLHVNAARCFGCRRPRDPRLRTVRTMAMAVWLNGGMLPWLPTPSSCVPEMPG
jgi:hypothetical protein